MTALTLNPFYTGNNVTKFRLKTEETSEFLSENSQSTLIQELESAYTSVTATQIDKNAELAELIADKNNLIIQRNKILDHFFRRYIPRYKKELAIINRKLDQLDQHIYLLEKEDFLKESDLNQLLSNIKASIEKYS